VTVLFSILFQSLHTYEHFIKQFASTECHHKYSHGEPEITHHIIILMIVKCVILLFGSYVSPEVFAYSLKTITNKRPIFLRRKTFISFPGSFVFSSGSAFSWFKYVISNQSLLCLVGMFHF
jgi:hypothetical protein